MISPFIGAALRVLAAMALSLLGIVSILGSGGGGGGGGASVTIVSQPADQAAFSGATATFSVTANNASGYQWQRLEGGAWTDIAGATASRYGIVASPSLDGVQLRVLVAGDGGPLTSNVATLTALSAAGISTEPADLIVVAGREAIFTVTASGTSPTFRWQISTDRGATWSDAPSGGAAALTLSEASLDDDGKQVRVIVSNGGGSATSRAASLRVEAPVAIQTQPASQTVQDGATASFTVVAGGASRYQWQSLDGSTWADVAGATAATYSFRAALSQSGQQLRVRVGGAGAGNELTSAVAVLTVTEAATPPSITSEPQDLTLAAGSAAVFSVAASGSSPRYRWQLSSNAGGTWADVANGSGATLVLPAVATGDNGKLLRVVVSNAAGSVTSRSATLRVFVPVAIVTQPAAQSVQDGATASFTVVASNASRYQWQRLNGSSWSNVAGATSASYSFRASLSQSGLQLRVVVGGEGIGNEVTSAVAGLTVTAAVVPPSITGEPQDLSVAAGTNAVFSVAASGTSPTYRWQLSSSAGASWSDAPNGSGATLSLPAVSAGDSGKQLRVVVSNSAGSVTSRAATLLVVDRVTIVTQPSSRSAVDGDAVTFSVAATSAVGYRWQRLDGTTWTDIAGATAASYGFTASLAQSGLQLRVVVVGNGSGNEVTSAVASLTVTAAVAPPVVTAEPQDLTVATGADAVFSVVASGASPGYRWQLSSNGGGSWIDAPNGSGATLTLTALGTGDSGKQVRVVVSNSAGSVTSRSATLLVLDPVAIVTQPASQTVEEGSAVTFSVAATNTTSYRWQRLDGASWTDIAGATSSSYGFSASLSQNGLQLRVIVGNALGSRTSSVATLSVTAAIVPIVITSQPRDATVVEGRDAAFAVIATGSSPTYRWQVSNSLFGSWTDVPGANAATFTVPAASLADDGKAFRVIVGNAAGEVISDSAALTVLPEFIVVSGGGACGGGGCGGDSGDGSGVGAGDGGAASAGPGLSAMRHARVTVYKPDGRVLGAADVGADYLVSLYPQGYAGPFIVEFADDGSGLGEYFDESLRRWLPLEGQKLRVMVASLTHHISANPMTEAAYQLALRLAGSEAALTADAMQQANALMLEQLNAKLPAAYQTTDVTNFVVPISDASGSGVLTNTWAGRYGAVMAALPIAGTLYDSSLSAPALAFLRQLTEDLRDDAVFNASATVSGPAYDASVAAQLNTGLCTAVSIWGSPVLPSQLGAQAAGPGVPGQLTLLAGTAGGAGNCDGWGSNARFDNPWRVAVDADGYVYVADLFNKTVRKISPQGAVRTLAGSPGKGGTVDGVGLAARFSSPHSIAVDAQGVVYVGDGAAIRKITPLGEVSTLAGKVDEPGYVDGDAAFARLGQPEDLAVDADGNVYVADSRYDFATGTNGTIRKITAAGVVSTLTTSCGPYALDVPMGVAVDVEGNVYIANTGQREICKLTPSGASSTLVHDGDGLQEPRGLAVDGGGNVYIADSFNEVVRKLTPDGQLTTLAGGLATRGSADGVGSDARFRRPNGVAVDGAGNVYVADEENHTIRKVTAGGSVTTLAGLAPEFGYADGTGSAARFFGPLASVADGQGNVYVLDAYNFVVRKVTPSGLVTTLAGSPGQRGNADGLGSDALFEFAGPGDDTRADRAPLGLAIDTSGNLYVTDRGNNSIRQITPQGLVTTVVSGSGLDYPSSVAVDATGNLYIARYSDILRVTPDGGVSVFANVSGALAVDASGSVYVAATMRRVILKITPDGTVSTLAGADGIAGTEDGIGPAARFSAPISIAVDGNGVVYVGEVGGHNVYASPDARTVRRITPDGAVSTVVGRPGSSGNLVGALPATLGRVSSVSVVGTGQIAILADDGVFLATFR